MGWQDKENLYILICCFCPFLIVLARLMLGMGLLRSKLNRRKMISLSDFSIHAGLLLPGV